MSIDSVLTLAENLCCEISVNPTGRIEIEGEPQNVDKLAPAVRENKTALLCHLTRARQHGPDPGRMWAPDNPFVCECGFSTGWLRDGKPLCPMCDGKLVIPAAVTIRPKVDNEEPATMPDGLNNPHRGELSGLENTISPVALSWLAENRVRLKDAGWTGRELYRRNKSKGICWCSLWEQPFLKIYLHDNGVIEFEAIICGKDIIQTARPMKQARKIGQAYQHNGRMGIWNGES